MASTLTLIHSGQKKGTSIWLTCMVTGKSRIATVHSGAAGPKICLSPTFTGE